ncbi:MAG: NLP/P60 hydrolase, partial [Rhodobacterales bacterium]|nr:NLP/P60 hydrolase [Rhodobacterales bacterium]
MDKRLTPANGRVAAAYLEGHVTAAQFVTGAARQITVPVADLLRAPDGNRERQLIWGDRVSVFEINAGWAFVQSEKDGFVGYLPGDTLGDIDEATHWISAPATHVYSEPSMKSRDIATLSFGARLRGLGEGERFLETAQGFVPLQHVWPITRLFT